MFCKNCGNELKEGAAFCAACGAAVRAREEAVPAPEAGANGSTPEEVSAGASGSGQTGAKKPRRAGRKKWIALAAAAAVAVIAGLCCFLYFTGDAYQCKQAMKHAAACLEEKEYRDALEYYEEALDLDETHWEAYLGSAECYLAQGNYEDALKLLKKGTKRAKDDKDEDAAEAFLKEASEKQEEAYVLGVDTLVKKADYSGAYSFLDEGIKETGSSALKKKLSEVYSAEAEQYLERSDYEEALAVLAEGYEATQDTSLLEKKSQVYLELARENMAQGAYESALAVLAEGYEATRDTALAEEKGQVYLAWSDAYLQSDVLEAIRILENGIEATGSEELAAREEYVKANVRATKAWRYDSEGRLLVVEEYSPEGVLLLQDIYDGYNEHLLCENTYDEAGNELSGTEYNSYGAVSAWFEYTYGGNGKVQSKALYRTDRNGNSYIAEECTYDEAGQERSDAYYDVDWDGNTYLWLEEIYDEYGKTLKTYYNNREFESGIEITYEYDGSGHLLKSTWYDAADGSVQSRREYTCDEDGHVLRVTRYGYGYGYDGSEENLEGWDEYTYDASGNVLSATVYGSDGEVRDGWERTYDSFGNVASLKMMDEHSSLLGEWEDLGLISRDEPFNYKSGTWTYEYAYIGQ